MATQQWVNLHTSHTVFTIEKFILSISCPRERVAWSKVQNIANHVQRRSRHANNSDGACAMSITANQQSFVTYLMNNHLGSCEAEA